MAKSKSHAAGYYYQPIPQENSAKNGINLKPLVMFKSQKIAESQENLDEFLNFLEDLVSADILAQRKLISEMDENPVS